MNTPCKVEIMFFPFFFLNFPFFLNVFLFSLPYNPYEVFEVFWDAGSFGTPRPSPMARAGGPLMHRALAGPQSTRERRLRQDARPESMRPTT